MLIEYVTMFTSRFISVLILGGMFSMRPCAAQTSPTKDYAAVAAIFTKHCLDCHSAPDPEAKLVMETFDDLKKGGESGSVIVPGKSSESLLVKMIEGNVEKDGKKKIMPPGKRAKLDAAEIAIIKAWIDAGATGPAAGQSLVREISVPKIVPKVPPRRSIKSLAYAPSPRLIAVGRYGEVELISADSRRIVRTLKGIHGSVNALQFSKDGKFLFAAGGEPVLFGEVREWKVADGTLIKTFEGHRDTLYSLALSPDDKTIATGSYDQKIKLWNVETGKEFRTLSGHNGAIFDLSFRADGKILASASADRTVKLWDVATGERRDTLSQSLKELYTVAFSPDGKRLAAGGVDNRIRVWQISDTAAETTNPILESRFAHEGAILKLVFSTDGSTLASSADDRSVRIWEAGDVKEKFLLESQPDWAPALAFAADNKSLVVGRLDGTLQFYDTSSGKVSMPPKPELVRADPRGIQRGVETKIRLFGKNLFDLAEIKFHNSKLSGHLIREGDGMANEAWALVIAESDLRRGAYELSVVNTNGESGKIPLQVDDLPQVYLKKIDPGKAPGVLQWPVSVWGTHQKSGDTDEFAIDAKSGQTLIFDVAAKRFGSKSEIVLSMFDSTGRLLATSSGMDGSNEPLLAHTFTSDGRFTIRINELILGASVDHFYRLSIGEFPYVIGCYPLSVQTNSQAGVELIGYNLPKEKQLKINASKAGEMDLPLDLEKFRSRRDFKILIGDLHEYLESEPNDRPSEAMKIDAPASVAGRIWRNSGKVFVSTGETETAANPDDADIFQFVAKAGQRWIIETAAAQRGTPVDTKIEVLHPDGKPVERVLLQAVRNSAVTFRGIDSNSTDCRVENWEEMELNQFLYLQGEVVKLFRAPQGPDSGFLFYTSNGKRRTYFDTSATAHANEEPCYIVDPHPPGSSLAANGLPVFALYYLNDDDGERKMGADSKLAFSVPADGTYLIRVTDTRGYSGERFVYRLVVREPKPDFKVTLNGTDLTINRGSGREFTLNLDRIDGFDGEVKVDFSNVPKGLFVSTPLIIQAGHIEAKGTINAALDAPTPSDADATNMVVKATVTLNGRVVNKSVTNFGKLKLGEPPKLFVSLEPDASAAGPGARVAKMEARGSNQPATWPTQPLEIFIAPGETVPALLKVKRNGHNDLVTFTVENLPHGVIVDNIGLNGVLIPKDQNERQIFLKATKWVPETDRLCFAVENQAGRQTSLPVMLHVRKSPTHVASAGAN